MDRGWVAPGGAASAIPPGLLAPRDGCAALITARPVAVGGDGAEEELQEGPQETLLRVLPGESKLPGDRGGFAMRRTIPVRQPLHKGKDTAGRSGRRSLRRH